LSKDTDSQISTLEKILLNDAVSDEALDLYRNSKKNIDVKSTSGEFERKIHISLSELELMSSDTERYDIYRIFNIDENNRTAKLRIAEEVRSFAKGI